MACFEYLCLYSHYGRAELREQNVFHFDHLKIHVTANCTPRTARQQRRLPWWSLVVLQGLGPSPGKWSGPDPRAQRPEWVSFLCQFGTLYIHRTAWEESNRWREMNTTDVMWPSRLNKASKYHEDWIHPVFVSLTGWMMTNLHIQQS